MSSSLSAPASSLLAPFFFFFTDPAATEIYTLSLHDALPICHAHCRTVQGNRHGGCFAAIDAGRRSEEHTSELQSRFDLVCRLLLEKKNRNAMALLFFATARRHAYTDRSLPHA